MIFFVPSFGDSGWLTIIGGIMNIDTIVETFLNLSPDCNCSVKKVTVSLTPLSL